MITKTKFYIVLICIISFFLGVLSQQFLMRSSNNTCDSYIQTILENENSRFYYIAMHSLEIAKEGGLDTTSNEYKKEIYTWLQQTNDIANYFNSILSSDEKLATFSFDTIRLILGEEAYHRIFHKFHSMENCIDLKKNTINEKRKYINFYYNKILGKLLEIYKRNDLIPGWIECVFYSNTDTIKAGEIYTAQVCLRIQDIQSTYKLEFENGDVFFGNTYTEKAEKAGINKRKGELIYLNGDHRIRFPFEFSFYVK